METNEIKENDEKMEKSPSFLKKAKKSGIIGFIIGLICILLCLYITIEIIDANNDNRPPRICNLSISYVPTESMEPTIEAKSYILFKGVDYDDIKVDDIIVYYNDGEKKFIVHRVIDINKEERYLTVQGDNNAVPDSIHVTPKMVYGKYICTLGILDVFSKGMNKNFIFFILVFIFIIMLGMQVFQFYLRSKQEKMKSDREKEKKVLKEELRMQLMQEELNRLKAERLEAQEKQDEPKEELTPEVKEEITNEDEGK